MLLKYSPRPAEVQEGVAFFGRSGQAILKSLQRLHVDPMAIYGTNCLKFEGATERQSKPWLTRELHIVQPKLVVGDGRGRVTFLNALRFPLSEAVEGEAGTIQHLTPTIEALVVPDIDASLDEQAAKSRFWSAFRAIGTWWSELPPY